MTTPHIRPGFHTVTPYLIVEGASGLVGFLETVFGATVEDRTEEEGRIANAALRVAGSMVELSEARDVWPARPGSLHVYVEDTDGIYRKALDAGATSVYEPADMPYGERSAGFQDPYGNHWYLATYTGG